MIIYDHLVPTTAIVFGVLAALAVTTVGYGLFVKRNGHLVVMVVSRLLFFLLLGWCLLLPGRRTAETLERKPRFLVLLDRSRSMTLTPAPEMTNRWQVAQAVLQMPWATTLAESCEMTCYALAEALGPEWSLPEVLTQEPTGEATLLRDALKRTVARYTNQDVAGCLLLSDGLDTREAFKTWAMESRPFPVYTLRLETDAVWEEEPDIRVETLSTPRRVTIGWQSELKVVLSGQGTKGQPFPVQLFKDGVLAQRMETQIPEGGGSRDVVFKLDHASLGVFTYRVVLPPLPGESQTSDNEASVVVQVLDAKNRLMYVEGPPRWESKYLSRVLRESKQVSPAIFLQGPRGTFMTYGVGEDVAPEMQPEQLAAFKIVVLGNLSGEELGDARAQALVRFVESGGSLVLLGGSKAWASDGFAATPLKTVLPAKRFAGKAQAGEFPVTLTEQGRSHAAFGGDPTFWQKIPAVLSIFPGAAPAVAARVLVAARTDSGEHPIILTQDYGQGKVVALFSDSLWKWQLSADALKTNPYPRFWHQLLSWLSPKEEQATGRSWEVFLDRESAFLNETVEVTARWVAEGNPPAGTVVHAEIVLPDKRKVPFVMDRRAEQEVDGKVLAAYGVTIKGEAPGIHAVAAVSETGGTRLESETTYFSVKPYAPEAIPRPPDEETLQAIAANSGGAYFATPADLDRTLGSIRPSRLERQVFEYKTYWQHGMILAILIVLIAAEWIMRKFQNLT